MRKAAKKADAATRRKGGAASALSSAKTRGSEKDAEETGSQQYGEGIDDSIAERICELIEETPKGLDHICENAPELVSVRTFHRWLEKSPALRQRYARARERQADFIASEILRIADTPHRGVKVKTDAMGNREVTEGDMIEHRRLQVDARKWLAGKLAPKKYGDKMDHTSSDGSMSPTRVIRPNAPAGQ